jgi:ATPase subunit of ABC transporter with duplicated ATPase domains
LHQEANQRRDQALKAERQRSKKHVDKHDHDTKARINLLRVTDSGSGQRLRQLDGRLDLAQARLRDLPIVKDANLGVTILGERSPGKHLIALEPTSLPLGQSRHLELPSLLVLPVDRIALVGANGTGKSTLVRHILSSIQLPAGRIAYLPQEIALDQSRTILNNFRRLPKNELGRAMTIVDRLGSSPQRLLQSDCPSPGELRKLLLASCMVTSPFLIILDEPTNHLDLPSIECLENALDDCEAALILVSHDRRFLKRLARTTWEIQSQSNGTRLVVLG